MALPSTKATKYVQRNLDFTGYLVGECIRSSFDKKTIKRRQEIKKLQPEDKYHLFALMDAFLVKCQVQNSLSA